MYIAADTLARVKTATALKRLRDATDRTARQWGYVVKIERTRLEGATPLTVSHEWSGYVGA